MSNPEYGSISVTEEGESKPSAAAPEQPVSLRRALFAEFFGTCILVEIGCGGLCNATYLGGTEGTWQAACMWILGATLAIYAVGATSGGHLNPAVTLAFASVRPNDFPWSKVLPYMGAQLLGAMAAGADLLIIYGQAIRNYEATNFVTRGEDDGYKSAVAFGDYYSLNDGVASGFHAFIIETFGTAFLTLVIFAVTHPRNNVPSAAVAPIVGATIGAMIVMLGPLTGAGINPARDFGPRLVTAMGGWGMPAFTNFLVYILGPLVGGPLGAVLSDYLLFL